MTLSSAVATEAEPVSAFLLSGYQMPGAGGIQLHGHCAVGGVGWSAKGWDTHSGGRGRGEGGSYGDSAGVICRRTPGVRGPGGGAGVSGASPVFSPSFL